MRTTETGAAEATEAAVLAVPAQSLVVLVGVSGSGKSTFAREKFLPYETLSSDVFRGMVSNDENDQSATEAAFEALRHVAAARLRAGLLTVIDATNVQPAARRSLLQLAKEHDVLPTAIVLDLPTDTLLNAVGVDLPQALPVSLPSSLVQQRPDIRSAEEQLHAASAQIGVAQANLLPQITLGATGGGVAGPGPPCGAGHHHAHLGFGPAAAGFQRGHSGRRPGGRFGLGRLHRRRSGRQGQELIALTGP